MKKEKVTANIAPKRSIKCLGPDSWDKGRLKQILEGFKGKKILVIGDLGLDRYTHGAVDRISPEAPVPIVTVQSEKLKLGLAANVADNIRTLGGIPVLVGVIGNDRTGDDILELLECLKVSTKHIIIDPNRRTVLKQRIVSERQQLLRVDYEDKAHMTREVEAQLKDKFSRLMKDVDGVILEDYAKGLVSPTLAANVFIEARKNNKFVYVDPPSVRMPVETYYGATMLKANVQETAYLTGVKIEDDKTLSYAGDKLLELTNAQEVIISRGKEGMAVFRKDSDKMELIPTYAREVYDVSGAGDTVISVLALASATKSTLEEGVVLANLAAGIEVSKRGTATVSCDEIIESIEFFEEHGTPVVR